MTTKDKNQKTIEPDYVRYDLTHVWDRCYSIYDQMAKANIWPDVIIGVARGGWIPARFLGDLFAQYEKVRTVTKKEGKDGKPKNKISYDVKVRHPHLLNVGMRRYTVGEVEQTGKVDWFQPIQGKAKRSIRNKVTLIVDDVFDVGESLRLVLKDIAKANPKELYAAVIGVKNEPFETDPKKRAFKLEQKEKAVERIKKKTGGLFFADKMDSTDWILYPWEATEETLGVYKKTRDMKDVEKSFKGHGVPSDIRKLIMRKVKNLDAIESGFTKSQRK